MRGRTNITPRLQPVINGDIENLVVAANNTIEKGDFVSYAIETMQNTVGITSGFYSDFIIIDESKSMFVFKERNSLGNSKYQMVIRLARVNSDGEVVCIDAIIGSNDSNANYDSLSCWYSEDEEVLSVKRYGVVDGSLQYYFEFYDVSENGFEKQQTVYKNSVLKSAASSSYDFNYFMKVGNKFVGTDTNSRIVTFDSNLSLVDIKNVIGDGNNRYLKIRKYDSNHIAFVGNGSNVSGYYGTYVVLYNINDYSIKVNHDDTDTQYDSKTFAIYKGVIFTFSVKYQSYRYYFNVNMYMRDDQTGDVVKFYTNNYSLLATATYVCGFIEDGKLFAVSQASGKIKVFVFEYDKTTKEVNIVQDEEQDFLYSINGKGFFAIAKGSDLYVMGAPNYYYKMFYRSTGVEVGQVTSYVRSYDGRNSLGFAKSGGNAGDTIQVYVPHNNS